MTLGDDGEKIKKCLGYKVFCTKFTRNDFLINQKFLTSLFWMKIELETFFYGVKI